MGKRKIGFYAVRVGRCPGIYKTWEECWQQVQKYPRAAFKKFKTEQEAQEFIGVCETNTYTKDINSGDGGDGGGNDISCAVLTIPTYERKSSIKVQEESVVKRRAATQEELEEHSRKKYRLDIKAIPINSPTNMVIFTDGSSLGNGYSNAQAGIGVFFGKNDPRNISERLPGTPQTNQRAEVYAVIRALETIPQDVHVQIKTDSKYTINAMTDWIIKWKASNWKKEIKNKDLFVKLDHLISQRSGKTNFEYIQGHAGHAGNEEADELARKGAVKQLP